MKKLQRLTALLVPFKTSVFLNVVFNFLSAIFALFSFASAIPFLKILFTPNESPVDLSQPAPEGIMDLVEYEIYGALSDLGPTTTLTYLCLGIVIVFCLKNIFKYLAMRQLAIVRNGVVRNIRQSIHHKIMRLPLSFFNQEKKGDLMSRFTNDVSEVEWSIIGSIEMVFRDPLTIVLYLGTMIWMNWELTAFVFILLPISGVLISLVGKSLKRRAAKGQEQYGLVLSFLEEHLGGMRVIKAFNAEEVANDSFDQANENHYRTMVRLFRKQYLASPISELLGAISLVVVLWFGGSMILDESSSFDGAFFIGYLIIFSQLIPPAKSFSEALFKIKKGSAALDRIEHILHAKEEAFLDIEPESISFNEGIKMENVSFSYGDNRWAIQDFNLEIKKGETVALVGPSGGGKSTCADLLCGFVQPQKGKLLLDQQNYDSIAPQSLRELIAIVPQEPILFNASVGKNIAMGKEEHSLRLQEAARIAHAQKFIDKLPLKMDNSVGERGNQLSGGQKQRLSIARAVYKNPPIMIFDEATSALDTQSERWVQEALNSMLENHTAIVVAHRLSTVKNADKIVVIDGGKIVEMGNHETLLENNGLYAKLCQLQNLE